MSWSLQLSPECLLSPGSVLVMWGAGAGHDIMQSDPAAAIGRPCAPPGWRRPGRRRVGSLVRTAAGQREGSPASCPGRTARGTSGPWRRSKISAVCGHRTIINTITPLIHSFNLLCLTSTFFFCQIIFVPIAKITDNKTPWESKSTLSQHEEFPADSVV